MVLGRENAKINGETKLTLTPLPNTVVNVKTQEEYNQLMKIYEAGGWLWSGSISPASLHHNWETYKEHTCVGVENGFLGLMFTLNFDDGVRANWSFDVSRREDIERLISLTKSSLSSDLSGKVVEVYCMAIF